MQTEKILQSDVLDIIFENKNKSYGAYALRKFYNNRLYKALGVMVVIVLVLCSFTLIKPKVILEGGVYIIPQTILKEVPKKKDKPVEVKKEKQQTQKQNKPAAADKFTTPKVTVNPKVDPIKTLDPNNLISNIDNKVPSGIAPKVGDIPKLGLDTITTPTAVIKPTVDKTTPTETADVMPAYPGGMAALTKFLQKNLVNPQDLEEGQKVSVKIKFIVGYDGQLKGFETIEDGGDAFNNEVIRVLKKMPNWVPGKMAGENVSVFYTVPVKFETIGE